MGDVNLKVPLAGLLAEGAGAIRRFDLDPITIVLDDDLELAGPISGSFEVSRTNRGVYVSGDVQTILATDCSRCLAPTTVALAIPIREEALPVVDLATGVAQDPALEPDVMRMTGHHELDLEPLLREAISLAAPIAPLCRPDCPGLCPQCGARLADGHQEHDTDDIDPRLAALRGFQVDGGGQNE